MSDYFFIFRREKILIYFRISSINEILFNKQIQWLSFAQNKIKKISGIQKLDQLKGFLFYSTLAKKKNNNIFKY